MNKLEYLLICLGEECAEVQKLVSKTLRFGIADYDPRLEQVKDNGCRLQEELNDVFAICEMLQEETGFNPIPSRALIDAKKAKMKGMIEYSRERMILARED